MMVTTIELYQAKVNGNNCGHYHLSSDDAWKCFDTLIQAAYSESKKGATGNVLTYAIDAPFSGFTVMEDNDG